MAVAILLAILALVACGFWYYRVETEEIVDERYRIVNALGESRASQVSEWRARLLHDVAWAADAAVTRQALTAALARPVPEGEQGSLADLLTFFKTNYDAAMVLTAEGDILAASRADHPIVGQETRRAIEAATRSGAPVLSDVFSDEARHIALDAAAPIRGAGQGVEGVLVLRANASSVLDPLLAAASLPATSAEAMLVSADDRGVVYLNALRFANDAAMRLRHPLTETSRAAVQAVASATGPFRGLDYRGAEVLADLRRVPGAPWFLVTQIDMAEIRADARQRAIPTALVIGLTIALGGLGAAYLHRRSQARLFEELHVIDQQVRESEQRFRTTIYSIGDAVVTTDTGGVIREMNRVAERLTGWREGEARGSRLDDVFRVVNEQTGDRLPSPVASVLRDGAIVELANHTLLIARDGTEVPIADSAAPIRDASGSVTGVVLVFSDQTSSHAARKQIEESEERLRLALRSANQGLWDLDVPSGEAAVSPEYASMLGYDAATFRETNAAWIERLHPDDREATARIYQDYVDGRLPEYRVEFRQRCADGTWKWILSIGRIVSRTADDRPLRMLGTHTDISDQKAAEQRIRRVSQLYATLSQCNQAIVRASSDDELFWQLCRDAVEYGGVKMAWIGMTDPASGRVVPVAHHGDESRYLEGITVSIDPDTPHGRGPTGTAIRENRPYWCNDFLADPATAAWRDRALRAGWASSAALPLHREGVPAGALMLYSDVKGAFDADAQKLLVEMTADISFALDSFDRAAAKQKAEREAATVRRQLEATLDAVPDLMFELGIDGTYYGYRASRRDLLAAPPDVFMGRRIPDVLPPAVADEVMAAVREAYQTGYSAGTTYQLTLPHGVSWFELSITRKVVEHGQAPRVVALARDITERKQAELQRQHLEAQLRESQKMEAIGQLAGGIAHDFNNLLTIINGRTDLVLARVDATHPFHEDLTDIRQAGERAAALTRQLLTFSRRQVEVPVVLSVPAGLAGLQGMLRRLISEDISLSVAVAPDAGAIRIPAGQFEQVILNLVVNARDAMPRGGSIAIDARAVDLDADAAAAKTPNLVPGRYVAISVTDTGVGMDEATRTRVFEPFFTTKGLGRGTGLGLSTVYGIVQQGGGTVCAESAPGRGSRFEILLPRVDIAAGAGRPAPAPRLTRGHETILVVDDEPALVAIASRILAAAGYTVLTAKDGAEALSHLATHGGNVDLLLTDVVIPGMSGRELAEHVWRGYPHTRVLFSSGYTDDEVLRRGVESSEAHFIAKPYSVAELTQKVREVLSIPAQ